MEYLPQEIVLDILSRLPVTSLVQVKFVCRSWRNLAQHPLLMDMHFSCIAENDPCLILHCDYPTQNKLYCVDLSCHNEDHETVKKFLVPDMPEFDVVGSNNGLLCLCDHSHISTIHIYNPFTRDLLELPKTSTCSKLEVAFGFGFCPSTKEYKVVKAVSCKNPRSNFPFRARIYYSPKSEVQIITLGSSTWRNLGIIPYHLMHTPSQVIVCGRLHWITWPQRYRPGHLLISLDLTDEEFGVVPYPDCGGLDRSSYHLVVLRGCLSAAVYCNYGKFDIWIMKEYGVKESWVKEFTIGTYIPKGMEQAAADQLFKASKFYRNRGFVRVLCTLKNGNILLEYKCRVLVSYDPVHKTFTDLTFQGMPNWFEALVHLGSLNWIVGRIDA